MRTIRAHFALAFIVACSVGLGARAAEACACEATQLVVVVRSADVVSEAIVGRSRTEPDGSLSSPVTFTKPLRGVQGEQRVVWHKPDGMSCNTVDLKPGRWMLFLSWSPDGRLVVTRCDAHSTRLVDDKRAQQKRKELMTHLSPIKTEAEAVAAAALAVRRMLVASVASKANGDSGAPAPREILSGEVDLARADRAIVAKQDDGSFLVRWSHHPPAGTSVDAEVRVFPDGVAQVVRADATFSPD